jgi:Transposase
MLAGLEAGDDDQQIGRAWIAAQELRLLYREPDRAHAERRLLRWFTEIAEHEIPELLRLARTPTPGARSCSPTSTPAACRTDPPRR